MLKDGNAWNHWLTTLLKPSLNEKLQLFSAVQQQVAYDTFEFSTITASFSIIKTVTVDSVCHQPKPNTICSPRLKAHFESINHLAQAFQLHCKYPTTLNQMLFVLSFKFHYSEPTEIRFFHATTQVPFRDSQPICCLSVRPLSRPEAESCQDTTVENGFKVQRLRLHTFFHESVTILFQSLSIVDCFSDNKYCNLNNSIASSILQQDSSLVTKTLLVDTSSTSSGISLQFY